MMRVIQLIAGCMLVVLGITGATKAAPFTINLTDVDQGGGPSTGTTLATYIGPGSEGTIFTNGEGTVRDGGSDAYDHMGIISGFGGLTVSRRTETFGGSNIYRWLDTYTNNTVSTINTTVSFSGNLGSDGSTTTESTSSFLTVTSDGVSFDPVIAHIYGNNAFAASNMTVTIGGAIPGISALSDNFNIDTVLSVAPGQSVSLLFMNFLARDLTDRSGDLALASSTGTDLVNSPLLTGLSPTEISQIANFDTEVVPEPSSLALLATGAIGFIGYRRRKRKQAA